MKSFMMFTMQLRSNRFSFVWISSILTTYLFEIVNHEKCNSSKSKNKFANSQFANRDSATNCTTRILITVPIFGLQTRVKFSFREETKNSPPEYIDVTAAQAACSAADCRIDSPSPTYLLEIMYSGSSNAEKKITYYDDSGSCLE